MWMRYKSQERVLRSCKEIVWANVYHDSIRDLPFLEKFNVNIGRMAGGYSFFYVLKRILMEARPKRILEFGIGESTRFINQFLLRELSNSVLTSIEHDEHWISVVTNRDNFSDRVKIRHLPLEEKSIFGNIVRSYVTDELFMAGGYDLIIVDGPNASERYSRFHIVEYAKYLHIEDQFIIMFDDYNRRGERETAEILLSDLTDRGFAVNTKVYDGLKSLLVITSEKYRFVTSL